MRTVSTLVIFAVFFVTTGCERSSEDSSNYCGPAVEAVEVVETLVSDSQKYRVMHLGQLFEGDSQAQRKLEEISSTNFSRTDLDASDYDRALNHWANQGWRLITVNKSNYWVFEKSQKTQTDLHPEPAGFECSEEKWLGEWDTNWGSLKLRHNFTEAGNISGVYGPEKHTIHGSLDPKDPRRFSGIWLHAGSSSNGRFRFVMLTPNKFEGAWTWGNDEPSQVEPNWTGEKLKNVIGKESHVGEL